MWTKIDENERIKKNAIVAFFFINSYNLFAGDI